MMVMREAMGRMPLYAIMTTVAVCGLINGFLFIRTHLHGPSIVVEGLHHPASLKLIRADNAYAEALAKRFALEYNNWTWTRHMMAMRRAAYFCDPFTAATLLDAARQKDPYWAKGLVTTTASPEQATVVESQPERMRFVVQMSFTVHDWESFLPSSYILDAQIVLNRSEVVEERGFLLWVTNYTFTPRGAPVVGNMDDPSDDSAVWAQISATGATMDALSRHESAAHAIDPHELLYDQVPIDDDDSPAPAPGSAPSAPANPPSAPQTPAAPDQPSPSNVPALPVPAPAHSEKSP